METMGRVLRSCVGFGSRVLTGLLSELLPFGRPGLLLLPLALPWFGLGFLWCLGFSRPPNIRALVLVFPGPKLFFFLFGASTFSRTVQAPQFLLCGLFGPCRPSKFGHFGPLRQALFGFQIYGL